MQTPEYVGSSATRMISGLAIFFALVTTGVWLATRGPSSDDSKSASAPKGSETSKASAQYLAGPNHVFYKTIGGAPEGTVPAPNLATKQSYTLEIKVTSTREDAEKVIDGLTAQGVEAYYTPLSRQGHVVYRVRRGVFTSHKAASLAAIALKEQHHVGTKIVKLQ